MEAQFSHLTTEQWEFLSVLHALEKPVDLEIAGKLSPILPAPFLNLMDQQSKAGFIKTDQLNRVFLVCPLPDELTKKLEKLNNKEKLSRLIEQLYEINLIDHMDAEVISRLLKKTGRGQDVAELEIREAKKALKNANQHLAMQHLWNVVRQLYNMIEDSKSHHLFVSATLKLSDLCLSLGTGFLDIPRFLKRALVMATQMGDRRSHALINLNLSIFYHIARQHDHSLKALSEGLKEVEELGDDDILTRSAAFIGLNFFLQGMFKDAEPYLERAAQDFELQGGESMTLGPLPMPFLLGYCLANLGHFHDAVGMLECSWRLAKHRSQDALATTIRTILGTVLQMVGKRKESVFHLQSAMKESLESSNSFAFLIAQGSLVFQAYLDGNIEEVLESMKHPRRFSENDEYTRLYTPPHFFEMIYEIEAKNHPPHPRINFKNELSWIEKAPNIHTKGAAYRLLAKQGMKNGQDTASIEHRLHQSEQLLIQSGDPVELAKTWIEMAHLKAIKKKFSSAGDLARKAQRALKRTRSTLFPENLKPLLKKADMMMDLREAYLAFIHQLSRIFKYEVKGENTSHIISQTLKYACRLFLSERGALFRIEPEGDKPGLALMAGYNFSDNDITGNDFLPAKALIAKAIKTKKPVFQNFNDQELIKDTYSLRSLLCLPILKKQHIMGLFYFDNRYLDNRFELMDEILMSQMAEFLEAYIDQKTVFQQLKRETSIWSSSQSSHANQVQIDDFVFESQVMNILLSEIKQVAETDTTLLIQGETGVGKEVIARQIHRMSSRNSGPFEVVDLTAIPETLIESELFGYEKGAFTGADNQKRGRFELTAKGTLFLDEIGEIPLSFQVKLLRVLQEKSFVRVGGTKTLTSNFRLIAATNRDLEKEVVSGKFRQDLFYRLNMIPIAVPPLRKREADIVVLAKHFLNQYAHKHNQSSLHLMPEDISLLTAYPWPGNIRELKNVMERAVLLSKKGRLDFTQLNAGSASHESSRLQSASPINLGETEYFQNSPSLEELERRYIYHTLRKTKGKIGGAGGASEILGIKRTTLYGRIKKLGIKLKS